jgi:hypothetical protein
MAAQRTCTSCTAAPTPWMQGSQASPPGQPCLHCSASRAKARRFGSAVAALKRMSSAVFLGGESTIELKERFEDSLSLGVTVFVVGRFTEGYG